MTPLPPQSPQPAPRYRFRPRSDHYTMPTFRAPMTPRVVEQPYERYDPRNEPRSSIELRELADPVLLVSAAMTLAGLGALLIFWFTA